MLAIDDHAAAETAGAKIVWGSSQNAWALWLCSAVEIEACL